MHPESSTLVRFESPHTPRHSRATDRRDRQIRKTRQRPAKVDGEISRSTKSPDIAPSSKANAGEKRKTTKYRESAETVAQTGDLALVKQ